MHKLLAIILKKLSCIINRYENKTEKRKIKIMLTTNVLKLNGK